jgi:sterol desaturase/sphingolipid hydroxylase (fatty acid hydroxylase superfamily)
MLSPDTVGWGLPQILAAIVATFAVLGLRSGLMVGGAFFWRSRSAFARRRLITPVRYRRGQLRSEMKAAVATLLLDAALFVLVASLGWLSWAPSGLVTSAVTFLALFVFTEIWFYLCHRALHTPWLFRIHRQHHCAVIVDPLTSLSFSVAERALLIGGVILFVALLSQVMPVTPWGAALYGLTNYALNVLGHSNVEVFPDWFARSRLGRWIVTPTYHSLHHQRFRGHFGLFTTVLDRIGGSVFVDYEVVQSNAAAGRSASDDDAPGTVRGTRNP